jgi:hypothetical protein
VSAVEQARCSLCSEPLRPDGTCPSCDGSLPTRWLNLTAGALIAIWIALALATIAIVVLLSEMLRPV